MAGGPFTLHVQNESEERQGFVLFVTLRGGFPEGQTSTLAWMTALVAPNGTAEFRWKEDFAVVAGTLIAEPGQFFQQQASRGVQVGGADQVEVRYEGFLNLGDPQPGGGRSVVVRTDTSIPQHQNFVAGLAVDDRAAVVSALMPNMARPFSPFPSYAITVGGYGAGQVIEPDQLQSFTISFGGGPEATVVFTVQGEFEQR